MKPRVLALFALVLIASACAPAVSTPTPTVYMATVTPIPADSADGSVVIEIQITIGSPTEVTNAMTGCAYGEHQFEELESFAESIGVKFELQEGKWMRAGQFDIDGNTPLQEKMTPGSYCAYFFQVNNYPDWLMRPLFVVTDVREVNGKKEYFVQHIQTDGLIESEPQMR